MLREGSVARGVRSFLQCSKAQRTDCDRGKRGVRSACTDSAGFECCKIDLTPLLLRDPLLLRVWMVSRICVCVQVVADPIVNATAIHLLEFVVSLLNIDCCGCVDWMSGLSPGRITHRELRNGLLAALMLHKVSTES